MKHSRVADKDSFSYFDAPLNLSKSNIINLLPVPIRLGKKSVKAALVAFIEAIIDLLNVLFVRNDKSGY